MCVMCSCIRAAASRNGTSAAQQLVSLFFTVCVCVCSISYFSFFSYFIIRKREKLFTHVRYYSVKSVRNTWRRAVAARVIFSYRLCCCCCCRWPTLRISTTHAPYFLSLTRLLYCFLSYSGFATYIMSLLLAHNL